VRLRRQDVGTRFANGGQARQGLSLTVGPGKLGSLGPNGAGTSTRMRRLTLCDVRRGAAAAPPP